MKEAEIKELVAKQRAFFFEGHTLPIKYRMDALKRLKQAIIQNEDKISEAIKKDLGKSNMIREKLCPHTVRIFKIIEN